MSDCQMLCVDILYFRAPYRLSSYFVPVLFPVFSRRNPVFILENLIKMCPVAETHLYRYGRNRSGRICQKCGRFLQCESKPIVIETHAGVFFNDRIHIIAAVAQNSLQIRAGHTPVGVLHQMADPGEEHEIRAGIQCYITDMVELRCVQVLE